MSKYKIIAYLADWADWSVQDIDAKKLTHINYAFATIEEGKVVPKVLNQKLGKIYLLKEIKAKNPHLKTLISIGGWGADGFSDAALTDESRTLFADTAVEFMKEYGPWETEEVYGMNDNIPEELKKLYEKYSSWEYRYGETPSFDMSFENRFTWGGIDINLSVEKGVISKAYVYSDAMDTAAAETLADLLPGTLLDRDEILKKLTEAGIKLAELEDVKNWLAEVL